MAQDAVKKQKTAKKEKKQKKPKKKSSMDIWDKMMVGVALLIFAPEAEAMFKKLDEMVRDFGEKLKDKIKIPEYLTEQIKKIEDESIPEIPNTATLGLLNSSGPDSSGPLDIAKHTQVVAMLESSGNPNAPATGTTTARGLYGFTEGAWNDMVKLAGKKYSLQDRFDPKKSTEVYQTFLKVLTTQFKKTLGRDPTGKELYMSAFLGHAGGPKFIQAYEANPKALATTAASKRAVASNPPIFYKNPKEKTGERTIQEVMDLLGGRYSEKQSLIRNNSPKVTQVVRDIPTMIGASPRNLTPPLPSATATNVPTRSTVGEHIDNSSRPVVANENRSRVIGFVNNIRDVYTPAQESPIYMTDNTFGELRPAWHNLQGN